MRKILRRMQKQFSGFQLGRATKFYKFLIMGQKVCVYGTQNCVGPGGEGPTVEGGEGEGGDGGQNPKNERD